MDAVIVYYLRYCPRDLVKEFVDRFDGQLRRTFETVAGLFLSDSQWDQASLPVQKSGLGLYRAADIADAACISSGWAAYDDCVSLDPHHVWDDGPARAGDNGDVLGEWLFHLYAASVQLCQQKAAGGLHAIFGKLE